MYVIIPKEKEDGGIKMRVYKSRLPEGKKYMFSAKKGVKVKLVNIDLAKKKKKNK